MDFFITRPIFASAIALIMILAGTVSMLTLPIAEYPPLVPPQVQVSTQYIGASAEISASAASNSTNDFWFSTSTRYTSPSSSVPA